MENGAFEWKLNDTIYMFCSHRCNDRHGKHFECHCSKKTNRPTCKDHLYAREDNFSWFSNEEMHCIDEFYTPKINTKTKVKLNLFPEVNLF